jgi:CHASE3 domain sensor protein
MGHELLQKIGNKLNELDYHSLDYPNLQADLNDLHEASHTFIELIDQFISLNKNEEILNLKVLLPSIELMIERL